MTIDSAPAIGVADAPRSDVPVKKSATHYKALDGLRGLAILMVLSHHFLPYHPSHALSEKVLNGMFGMGWAGVDLFFCLSGFLITGILFDSRDDDRYFRNFYARRTLRIFPLYYGMLILCTLVLPSLGLKASAPVGSSGWWWFYLSNVRSTYWPDAKNGWLGFYWSLAVEEHFYLVWPVIILVCNRKTAMRVCIACFCIATLSRAGFIFAHDHRAPYLLTPCRIDALAAGAWVALAARGPGGIGALLRNAVPVGLATLAFALIVAFWRHSIAWDPKMQLLGFPLVACSSACFIIMACAMSPSSLMRRVLEFPQLRTIGKYSYGMYIFQGAIGDLMMTYCGGYPFKIFPAHFARANDAASFLIVTAEAFTVAFISWHLYEKHFIKLKRYFEYSPGAAHKPIVQPLAPKREAVADAPSDDSVALASPT